jgi:DNA-directed RNA polymerase subunit N (RpoN/RPB10)
MSTRTPINLRWKEIEELLDIHPVRCQFCNKVWTQTAWEQFKEDIARFEQEEHEEKTEIREWALSTIQQIESEQSELDPLGDDWQRLEDEKRAVISEARSKIEAPTRSRIRAVQKHRRKLCCLEQVMNKRVAMPTTRGGIYEVINDE